LSEVTSGSEQGESLPTRTESVWASVGFWLTVFAATALLGSVVLAPRLERVQKLLDELRDLTAACVHLDRKNERLARFLRALEHDPTLVEQLADWELKGRPPEQMPALFTAPPPTAAHAPSRTSGWWRQIIHLLATDPLVERAAYLTVAGLYLIALTFFRGPTAPSKTVDAAGGAQDQRVHPATANPVAEIDPNSASDDEWLFCD